MNGWKLVPVEPTHEMAETGDRWSYSGGSGYEVWNAMLAAAPQPPVGGDVEVRRVSVEMLKGGSWRYKAEPDGALVMAEDHHAHVTALQARVAVLQSALEGMVEYFPEGHSDGECFSVEVAKAALAQQVAQ